MLDQFKIITITHQHLNVEDIAQFAIHRADLPNIKDKLHFLSELLSTKEIVYLNTCNRVSYIFHGEQKLDKAFLIDFFSKINPDISQLKLESVLKYVQCLEDKEAVDHLFKVAASMESMVVGEREIFRQLREAFNASKAHGFIDDQLRLLERHFVTTAKAVYAKTGIGKNPVSIVSLAMKKFLEFVDDRESKILLIGAGETNSLVGKFLAKYQFKNVTIFNRSLDNAQTLRTMLGAEAFHLTELKNHVDGFDAIFICTAAAKPIIDSDIYRSLLQRDTNKKIIVDLSVPHNVEHQVIEQNDIEYIDIEQLRALAEHNLNLRKGELEKAKVITNKCLADFSTSFQHRQIEKMLTFIPKEIEQVKQHALENVYKQKIEALDPDAQVLIKEMMDYMAKKSVAIPMKLSKTK